MADAIFHYTSFEAFKAIVETKAIWGSDVRYLNDYMEVENGKRWLHHLIEIFHDEFSEFKGSDEVISTLAQFLEEETTCFAACFCSGPDLLSQWRGYGEGRPGLSIGFDAGALATCTNLKLVKINYDEDAAVGAVGDAVKRAVAKIKAGAEPNKRAPILAELVEALFFASVTSKNRSFEEEREYRLIAEVSEASKRNVLYRVKGPLLIPYIKLDLTPGWPAIIREVWIGPSAYGRTTWESVREFIDYHGLRGVTLHRSSSPYRA